MAGELKKVSKGKIYYRGFSSSQYEQFGKDFSITNVDVIKRDIYTEIMTEIGTRVKMPNFGTRIPTLTFEPNDLITINVIKEDITKVINNDPRVKLLNMEVVSLPSNNAILAFVDLLYIEMNIKDTIRIEALSK